MAAKPNDDTITLVAFLLGHRWVMADEIRHGVKRLGFEMPSSQWVAGRLRKMARESAPRFERREAYGYSAVNEYRVTGWAMTGFRNTWRRFDAIGCQDIVHLPDLPICKPEDPDA